MLRVHEYNIKLKEVVTRGDEQGYRVIIVTYMELVPRCYYCELAFLFQGK
jgi:hypothetical protein